MNIVIVGASRGIGMELAAHCSFMGHNITGLGRTAKMEWLAWPLYGQCDATSRRQLIEVREKLEKTWTHLDALICCAARLGPIGRSLFANHDWIQSAADNLAATLLPIQVFGRMLRLANDPKVICFSGGGAARARPHFSAYACAKTAIVRLVETVAAEEPWLDINAVAPGAISTDMTKEVWKHGGLDGAEYEEARRAISHRDERLKKLFACIDWLLSTESSGISGRLIAAQHDDWEALRDQPNAGYLRRTELSR